ncbi:unnamed protein product [Symbiodinium natans]|uniref:Uncharacterized protein n=1 Tax=Symbiodinium natans TaxID=878477 RepID=A0A812TPN3_9DINO|nr:unnamed protein product [Symbiodinium natans]
MSSITTRETPAMRIQRLKEEQRQQQAGVAPSLPRGVVSDALYSAPPANLFKPPADEPVATGTKRKAGEASKLKKDKKGKKKEKKAKKSKKDKKDKKKKGKKGKKDKKKKASSDSSDSSSSDDSDSS